MSTEREPLQPNQVPQPEEADAFSTPEGGGDLQRTIQVLSENIGRLENDLTTEKDNRNEERLYWLLGIFIPLNITIHHSVESFGVFSLLFFFQLVVLLNLAKKFGHEWAVQALGTMLKWFTQVFQRDQ